MRKLLILGADYTEIEIVTAAREMGYYSIVTDNRTDWTKSPAKYVADEAWNISYSDIDLLTDKCRENGVEGCMAGFSEFRINFKEKCLQNGITVPKSYKPDEDIQFPVIVKPVDNGGSKGISICFSDEQLKAAHALAVENSSSRQVLIEQYIQADEVMIYFTVHNGIVDLSAMCDRYMHRYDRRITQLPIGYCFPSKHLETFVKYHYNNFKDLIEDIGIKNGLIAFQSFVIDKDVIPFDPTYRLDCTMSYHLCQKQNQSNVLKMLINYSMNSTMGDDELISSHESPYFEKFSFELPILLGKGTISVIRGIEEIRNMKEVIHVFVKQGVNDVMGKTADFLQMFCRIHLLCNNESEMLTAVRRVFDIISILDESGNDMIINRNFFAERIIQE